MEAPTLLDAGTDSLAVQWLPHHEAVRYEAQMAVVPGDEYTVLSSKLTSTQLRKKNLQPDTPYTFRVRAIDRLGEPLPLSPPSAPFTTLPPLTQRLEQPPTLVRAEAGALSLQWPPVDACTGYELQMAAVAKEGQPLEWTTIAAALKMPSAKKKGEVVRLSIFWLTSCMATRDSSSHVALRHSTDT
jgi:Fibronectin type III domain